MKIIINKIILSFLLLSIFTMAKGLCFEDLLSIDYKINIAHAEISDINIAVMDNTIDFGVCGKVKDDLIENIESNIWSVGVSGMLISYEKVGTLRTKPFSNHNKSLLPCCLEGNHPIAIVSVSPVDLEKSALQIFFTNEKIQFESPETVSYLAPMTVPPELYSIQKTILRL